MISSPARRAFTLIEMLVATVLSAVLMMAVLSVLAGVSRDRKGLNKAQGAPRSEAVIDRIRWDLVNASTMQQSPDGRILVLNGHGGIDPHTLMPTGRLARVTYRCLHTGKMSFLVRDQRYLDDAARPQPWRQLVATGITGVTATARTVEISLEDSAGDDTSLTVEELLEAAANKGPVIKVPTRVGLQLDETSGPVSEELWIK